MSIKAFFPFFNFYENLHKSLWFLEGNQNETPYKKSCKNRTPGKANKRKGCHATKRLPKPVKKLKI